MINKIKPYIIEKVEDKKHLISIQKRLFVELDEEEQRIYDYLLKSGKDSLDTIALACRLPIYKISGILLNMELKGVIRPLPGKIFEAI